MTNDTSQISEREREILRLVATGATNQQKHPPIQSWRLPISQHLARSHLKIRRSCSPLNLGRRTLFGHSVGYSWLLGSYWCF